MDNREKFSPADYLYMRRALQLAANGRWHVSPNPMVGAVIVDRTGRIIGEGWHRHYGGPHAEVNAVNSVSESDRSLLGESTIYVTLEPCSHYGKTPPCARLLTDIGIGRVVVGAGDPNPKVSGRGVAMIRAAGIRVDEGLLAEECRALNKTFMTAHSLHRPFVTLKWAQSSDGFMDHKRSEDEAAAKFSTPLSSLIVHERRASHDAIAVGGRTAVADRPRLDTRLIAGPSPRKIVFDRHGLADMDCYLHVTGDELLADVLESLYREHNITSLLVEGGASLLDSFIDSGLWDEAYIEVSAVCLGEKGAVRAPLLPSVMLDYVQETDGNRICRYVNFPKSR